MKYKFFVLRMECYIYILALNMINAGGGGLVFHVLKQIIFFFVIF